MKLAELARSLELSPLTPNAADLRKEVSTGYVSDLLSDVLAHAPRGGVLVTVQVHLNVLAVAVHAELAGVIFAANRAPEPAVREKAAEEGLALFSTPLPAFEVVGRMHALGIRGGPA